MCAQQSTSVKSASSTGPSPALVPSGSGVAKTGDTSPHPTRAARADSRSPVEELIASAGKQSVCAFFCASIRFMLLLTGRTASFVAC